MQQIREKMDLIDRLSKMKVYDSQENAKLEIAQFFQDSDITA